MIKRLVFSASLLFATTFGTMAQHNLIPYPNKLQCNGSEFTLSKVEVSLGKDLKDIKTLVQNDFASAGISVSFGNKKANVVFTQNKQLPVEGYTLNATDGKVAIGYADASGAFYAMQTLKQLWSVKGNTLEIPNVGIEDSPAYQWRAFMLDEGRYFKGKEVVFQLLDQMAALKMNTFHWHLTDDQGWRIEIKKYPKLTEVGGFRKETEVGGWNSKKFDGNPHGGFYTQKEIKEIVAYAAKRGITIVPEIEMPGHASAAIAAYPWLGVKNEQIEVPTYFGVHYAVYDVTNPKVYEFMQDVLAEVFELFPSQAVHIGGDEVKFDQWKESNKVADYMKQKNIKTYPDLQIAFTNQISSFIDSKGRRMMGWNEIMGKNLHGSLHGWEDAGEVTSTLSKSSIIHFWAGQEDLINDALNKGYDIVNSMSGSTYLDYDYNSIPLEKAYGFNPIPKGVKPEQESQVLGLGCQMWGEWIPTVESMNQRVYPRIAAYAEVGWTKAENKDFARFTTALDGWKATWKKLGINYHE